MPSVQGEIVGMNGLPQQDAEKLLAALIAGEKRVQSLSLSCGTVWIKRHGDERRRMLVALQNAMARLFGVPFMRPSPPETGEGMVARDLRRIERLADADFPTAAVIYSSGNAIVLSDIAPTVHRRLRVLEKTDVAAHDELLIFCCGELGRLHAAGICHGRPFPRDMFLSDGRLGFIDFEEEPEAAMPMAIAQARDLWLFFLQLSDRAIDRKATQDLAYRAWANSAPPVAIEELRTLARSMGRFLWFARLIGRFHMGRDLRQFILATNYLKTVSHG